MRKLTHLVTGITIGVAIAYILKRDNIFFPIIGGFFGIMPDFDIVLARLGIGEHRGAHSHSLLSSLIVTIAVYTCLYLSTGWTRLEIFWLASVAFLASFVHTATDSLTRGGTRLFFPFSRRRFSGWLKYDDWLVNGLLIVLCVLLIAALGQLFLIRLI